MSPVVAVGCFFVAVYDNTPFCKQPFGLSCNTGRAPSHPEGSDPAAAAYATSQKARLRVAEVSSFCLFRAPDSGCRPTARCCALFFGKLDGAEPISREEEIVREEMPGVCLPPWSTSGLCPHAARPESLELKKNLSKLDAKIVRHSNTLERHVPKTRQ